MGIIQASSTSFQPEQCRAYFASRLPDYRWNGHAQINTNCPFHSDSKPSLSVNLDKGLWNCKAGCGAGGIFDFEEQFSGCDREQARRNVAALLGISFGPEPTAVYIYHDAVGRVVFRKLRYPDKKFVCQRPRADGKGWDKGLNGITLKPLYRLPELVRASYAIITEGEKDGDRLASLDLGQYDLQGLPVAITTNFDGAGAGKWRPEYSPYFTGKTVTIIPDNDAVGQEHALAIAQSISRFACGVKIVQLPGLANGGDVSDYLDAGHSAEELIEEIQNAPQWRADVVAPSRFKSIAEIVAVQSARASWIIPHYIERTAITQLAAKIKCGKTSFVLSACKSILTGVPFLGQPVETGSVVYITEQAGSSWIAGLERAGLRGCEGLSIMQLSDSFGLDWPQIVAAAIEECQRVHAALLVIDTLSQFAGLSGEDENNAGRMLEAMRPLQRALGHGFGVLYAVHERKSGGEVSDAARGSSAVGGVADVLMSLRKPSGNHEETIRKIAAISRFSETPSELVIKWTLDGVYVVVGDSDAVTLDRATAAVQRALPVFEDSAKTIAHLVEETGESRTTVRRALISLRASMIGDGEKGNPFRYFLRIGRQ